MRSCNPAIRDFTLLETEAELPILCLMLRPAEFMWQEIC